jgi:hypothetical protein
MIQLVPQLKILLAYEPVDFRKLFPVIILTLNNVYNVSLSSRFLLCRILNSLYFYNVVKVLNEGSKGSDFGAQEYLLARRQ